MAYSHAQGQLHEICSDSPGVQKAADDVLQRACDDLSLSAWLSSDTPAVQVVVDLLDAFCDDVSHATGVRRPPLVHARRPNLDLA